MRWVLLVCAASALRLAPRAARSSARRGVRVSATSLKPFLGKLIGGDALNFDESRSLFGSFLGGDPPPPEQIAAVLCLLRAKGESAEEIAGAATAMRDACVPVDAPGRLLDIVGTGGDGANTINLSTASAILAAACGAKVTKCGNRSVSSACGAADVLEALGLDLDLSLPAVTRCIEEVGLGFLYAPRNHPAMKAVAPVRKALGVRTAFNLLGPLTNAAGAQRVVIGVFEEPLVALLADALVCIGVVEHAVVIHGVGLDEISPLGPCTVLEVKNVAAAGEPKRYEQTRFVLDPLDYDMPRCTLADLVGGDAAFNALALRRCLAASDATDACRDAIALNAGMGLYVYGAADSVKAGIELARVGLRNGAGLAKLDEWIAKTQALATA